LDPKPNFAERLASVRSRRAAGQLDPNIGPALTLGVANGKGAAMADKQTDSPPDRLSLDPRSDYYDEELLSRGVGIKFNGQEKTNVIEYSISEGWIRVPAGKSRDRYGQPMTIKLKGAVEPYFEGPAEDKGEEAASQE
jgi:hypothetical protein